MANIHKQFVEFCEKISLTESKEEYLKISKNSLRDAIKKSLSDKSISFYMQGSYAMKTIINPINDEEYDLDDGVYFNDYENVDKNNWPTPETVHSWIKSVVINKTKENQDKNTCVRIFYEKGYHIDLPSYIKYNEKTYLAHKKDGWILSDPQGFKNWFIEKVNNEFQYGEQLRKVVKYLKAWRDYRNVPLKGIHITILATNHFTKCENRDDKAIYNTVCKIINYLNFSFDCYRPVEPRNENLFKDMSEINKEKIKNELNKLKDGLQYAIEVSDISKATSKMQELFGNRFPLAEEKDNNYIKTPAPGVLRSDGRSA